MRRHATRLGAERVGLRGAAGFTLLELMVALTLGGIAITSIYAIGAASTRTFYQQQRVAGLQTSVRAALAQVKRDLSRAGFLATPAADRQGETCGLPMSTLHDPSGSGGLSGVSKFIDNVNEGMAITGLDPTGNNPGEFSADEVVLIGNYATAAEYAGIELLDPSTIGIDQDWHGFTRDFTNLTTGTFDDALFDEAFRVGRMIRIKTTRGLKHFAIITGVTKPNQGTQGPDDDALVQFTPAVPASCANDVDGGWVAPVSAIRYMVRDLAEGARGVRFPATTGPVAQLLRREVVPTDKTNSLDGTNLPDRSVLDYAVAFNLKFQSSQGSPQSYDRDQVDTATISGTAAQDLVRDNPEWIRSISIDMAARSPHQDATLPFDASLCGDLRCFQVFPPDEQPGAARVRRVRAEVFVPNIAFENY
ncbi:MAG: prepilin-type N-terminal cleavage/methylation domain-containing protein [Myxococcales bacterium]|jgi:prepilin-type N-terminal cleavage/methylation domain-containing protein